MDIRIRGANLTQPHHATLSGQGLNTHAMMQALRSGGPVAGVLPSVRFVLSTARARARQARRGGLFGALLSALGIMSETELDHFMAEVSGHTRARHLLIWLLQVGQGHECPPAAYISEVDWENATSTMRQLLARR